MDALQQLRRLWQHLLWADGLVLEALLPDAGPAGAWREYVHLLAVEELWLARLEQRRMAVAVWPRLSSDEVIALREQVMTGYEAYFAGLTLEGLADSIPYTTSEGDRFESVAGDILLQVILHGQYHRGKVNVLLRQAGSEPAPVDYIAFVRGAPAAVTPIEPPG